MIGTLTTHLWQSTVFALVAAAMTAAFRKNRAKVRYWLWLCASLKFFVPFGWLIRLGTRLEWAPVARGIATPDVSMAMERIAQPFTYSLPPTAPASTDWTRMAIAAVWLGGLLAIAAIRLRLWLRVRAAVDRSTRLDLAAGVEVRSTPALLEPGVVGLLHPILLLPEGIVDRLTPAQLEAVLAHELCHVRRRDNLFSALHMLVEAVFWFHPLVWWIGARLVEERERACDEGVLSLGNEPRTYADAILHVCKLYVESPLACVSGVTGADLKRRIEAIMNNHTGQGLNGARKLLLAAAGIATLAGPIATGVLIGVGRPPAIHAQTAVAAQRQEQTTRPPAPNAAQSTAAPAARDNAQSRRLVALLFDPDSILAEELFSARQTAIGIVRRAVPDELVAVMSADSSGVRVVQDFTADRPALESALQSLSGGGDAPTEAARISRLETAARMLGSFPGKKELVYFSRASNQAGANDRQQLRNAVNTAVEANVAFYAVDTSAAAAQVASGGGGGRSMNSAVAAGSTAVDEPESLRGLAQSSAMRRTSLRHGQPDQVEDRESNGHKSQIWRYNHLENFQSNVEYEFGSDNHSNSVRINWPPPVGTFTGIPGPSDAAVGLPGGHASIQTYPAGEIQTVTIPLESLSGQVDIKGQVKRVSGAPGSSMNASFSAMFLRDKVSAANANYSANFTLDAGSFVCNLTVRDLTNGQTYEETIHFDVK